jgi:GT2 family glycosyltransferase
MMVRRAAVKGGTFFDEAFFLYGEDMDASMALRRDGWGLLYVPEASAAHRVKASTGRAPEHIYRMQVVNPLVCIRRHRPAWECAGIKAVMGAGYFLRALAYAVLGLARLSRPSLSRAARQWSYFRCLAGA